MIVVDWKRGVRKPELRVKLLLQVVMMTGDLRPENSMMTQLQLIRDKMMPEYLEMIQILISMMNLTQNQMMIN